MKKLKLNKIILLSVVVVIALFWSVDDLKAWHVGNHNPGPVTTTGNLNYCFTFGASNGQGERGPWNRCTTDATFWHWPSMAEGDWGLNVTSYPAGYRIVGSSGGCSNRNGQTCSMWVNFERIPAPVVSVSVSSSSVVRGQNVTVSWSVSGSVTSCRGTGNWPGWSGANLGTSGYSSTTSGGLTQNPTTFGVTCDGPGGSGSNSKSVTVTSPPSVETRIRANGSDSNITVAHGSVVTIDWGSNNATSCTSTGNYPSWTGQPIAGSGASNTSPLNGPADYTFGMTCTGQGGTSSSDSISVHVNSPPAVETRIRANNSDADITVPNGSVVTIDWGSNNASSCTSTGDYPSWTGQPIAGSGASNTSPLNGPITYTFGMSCTGSGGSSSSDSIRVTVSAPPNRQPIGNHDTNDCSVIGGWAYDPDTSSSEISVHITDGPLGGGGVYIAAVPTSVYRGDVNATYGITGNHGFHINTPNSLRDGQSHTIYVYAIDSSGTGTNPIISSSPKTLRCDPIGNITVTSRDTSGSPVEMEVTLLRTGGPTLTEQIIRNGSHTFTGVSTGEWDMRITRPENNDFIWEPVINPQGKQTLNTGGTITWGATWTPNTPPNASITCNGSSAATVPYGGQVRVQWTSDGSSCSVSPTGWSGTSGDQTVSNLTPPDKTYTLTCTR